MARAGGPSAADLRTCPRLRHVLRGAREIGRLPLGTRHTVGAYKIVEALHNLRVADPTGSIRFLLDVTGVGEGVADLIEGYVPNTVKMTRCWFTSAERLDSSGREWRVGKPWMVSRLTSLLETGRVRLPDTPQSQALVEELRDFEYRVTPSANLVAEARVGAHDDLVTALGLATPGRRWRRVSALVEASSGAASRAPARRFVGTGRRSAWTSLCPDKSGRGPLTPRKPGCLGARLPSLAPCPRPRA
jgi:hypothetical protein